MSMKNLISVIAICLLISGSVAAADYWHLGIGLRGTLVIPGEDYKSALGVGIVTSLGDPDSKFTTRLEVDRWKVVYDYDGSVDSLVGREHQYLGLGFSALEKYRILNHSARFSPYVIAGLGAYFLELKREEDTDIVGIQLRSKYIHSLMSLSGGLGIEAGLSSRVSAFIEGRYVGIFSENNEDKDLIHSYIGVTYLF
jgi:opacity protein-like surface antigen